MKVEMSDMKERRDRTESHRYINNSLSSQCLPHKSAMVAPILVHWTIPRAGALKVGDSGKTYALDGFDRHDERTFLC